MLWNCQKHDWLRFANKTKCYPHTNQEFLVEAGGILSFVGRLGGVLFQACAIETNTADSLSPSEIEGGVRDRDSVHPAICRYRSLSPLSESDM